MGYLLAILVSLSFSSYYQIGDTLTEDHQNTSFDVCYGDYPSEQFQLGDVRGKIIVFGISASWWPYICTTSLEVLINDYGFGEDSRIHVVEHFDDPGQPYQCDQWGNIGSEGIPMLITDNLPTYEFQSWFSLDATFMQMGIIDPNMVYRYYGTSTYSVSTLVDEIISETNWLIGDINFDTTTNILDIITFKFFI